MTTASDIITRAARALGYLGRTEVLSAADANDGLACFNALLDSWSNETLMSYVSLTRSFVLAAMTQTYTIGASGVINSTRPSAITDAFVRDTNNNDYGLEIWNDEQWNSIGNKAITSQIPNVLFYDSQYPLGVINIWPIPLVGYTVYFDSTLDQVDFSTLVQTLSLPVGYERAFVMNLAIEMESAGFPCLLDEKAYLRLVNNASEAKANIKRANIKPKVATYDAAIVSHPSGSYNVYRDSNN